MKTLLIQPIKSSLGLLTLVLALAGCTMAPYSPQPTGRTPNAKAPVVDRSARRPPGYPAPRPAPEVDVGQVPEADPLLPREYASGYPSAADPYAAPNGYGTPAQPYPDAEDAYPSPAYPPATGNVYQQPSYPPGAATPYPPSAQRYSTAPTDDRYPPRPAPGALPEPQPVVPKTPRVTPAPTPAPPPAAPAPAPSTPTVALAPQPTVAPPPEPEPEPEPIQPPPRTAAIPASPLPPAELPPAEITREGNQAVAALLDSADKYVKSKQLDKAGAALERALRIEPRNAGIWHDLAQIRLHQGQYQQAESLASKSNSLTGGNRGLQSRNWKVIAVARKATGNVAGAEEAEARAAQFSR